MHFPVTCQVLGHAIPIHSAMEVVAFFVGIAWYVVNRLRGQSSPISGNRNIWLVVFLLFGSIIGSRFTAWLQTPFVAAAMLSRHPLWMLIHGGQEVVGGLVGGWIGAEIGKIILGIKHSTGDAMVFPIMCGMAIGRIGCFLTGLQDGTCGLPTHLPWGVNFGDGIPRQPVQIFDILFLITLGIVLYRLPKLSPSGARFRVFMAAYCSYRVFIDFLKPQPVTWLGFSAIQWLALTVAVFCGCWLYHRRVFTLAALSGRTPQPQTVA